MRSYLLMLVIVALPLRFAAALPFYWEPKSDEPGFMIDVPATWNQASRSRDKVANVHFERRDKAGRVAIEVRAYSSENTDIEQLILQLRSRLAVKYDRVFLLKRREVPFRKNVERQLWSARVGKKNYTLMTSFVVADNQVLQLICVAPTKTRKNYEYIFDNALLSLDFSEGKPDDGGGQAEAAETPAAPASTAPAPTNPAPAASAPATPAPAAPPAKGRPPKIDF